MISFKKRGLPLYGLNFETNYTSNKINVIVYVLLLQSIKNLTNVIVYVLF